MALLTADDVLNKKFQPTKFREGYDQDEVDDFLDEVVDTLSALQSENEELKGKLAAAEQRVAELSRGAAREQAMTPPPMQQTQQVPPPTPVQAPPPPVQQAQPEPPKTAPGGLAPMHSEGEPESATGMLALAQRLHDEYVRSGQEEGDRILNEAKVQAAGIIREAEETSVRTLGKLEQDRALLERKIDELRIFERDYRTRLKAYLENLLTDLEGKAPQTSSNTSSSSGQSSGSSGSWDQRSGGMSAPYHPFGS